MLYLTICTVMDSGVTIYKHYIRKYYKYVYWTEKWTEFENSDCKCRVVCTVLYCTVLYEQHM